MKIAVAVALACLAAQDKGAPAPEFAGKNQAGKDVKFADLKGKKAVLLAFYPKDATPG
jgi:peroxiredoxin Q/BCP